MDIAKWVNFGCQLLEKNVGQSICLALYNLHKDWRSRRPCEKRRGSFDLGAQRIGLFQSLKPDENRGSTTPSRSETQCTKHGKSVAALNTYICTDIGNAAVLALLPTL